MIPRVDRGQGLVILSLLDGCFEELREVPDRDSAKLVPGRHRAFWGHGILLVSLIYLDCSPEYADISILAVTDPARDVEIVARKVRRRIEKLQQILAADHWSDHRWLRVVDFPQGGRSAVVQRRQKQPRSVELAWLVWQRNAFRVFLVTRIDVDPENPRVTILARSVASSHPLNERGPGGQLGDERASGHVDAGLNSLGRHDDPVAFGDKHILVLCSIWGAKPRVHQG